MIFWSITLALALAVVAILVLALTRGTTGDDPAAAYDLKVYRDQLREVERDRSRGVIGAEDAARMTAEISRRVLTADAAVKAAEGAVPAHGPAKAGAVLAALAVLGGTYAIYTRLGAPGYGDLALTDRIAMAAEARATRPTQAEAEAQVPVDATRPQPAPEFADLMAKLREAVAKRPDDVQGHQLLARNEAALGNFAAAYQAQGRILSMKGDQASAQDYLDYADMLILAAGGYVSPQAEGALTAALNRDLRNGAARYYMGLMFAQTGRPDTAFRLWDALLREGPEEAPWVRPIREQIEEAAMRAGVDYEMPRVKGPFEGGPALKGPSAQDVQAAGDMTAEDRQNMIRTMVTNLAERLGTEGGTPAEWARLIGAYGVLGEVEKARAIWAEAQTAFAGNAEALAEVRAAAVQAGVAE